MRSRRPAKSLFPDDLLEPTGWVTPRGRSCRGVQLVHIGQVCRCIDDTCPDPAAPHTVSFRCIVMTDPCPTCGASAWTRDPRA